nr:hypothetical protein [Tanacetum cinerariifolium]
MIFLAHNRKFGAGGEKYTSNNMNKEWVKVRDRDGRRTKLWNVEVKYMGGLEVMVVLESEEAVKNVIENIDHGIRRVPIVCWKERVFKLISSRWEDIMEFLNCNLNRSHGVIVANPSVKPMEENTHTSKPIKDDGDMHVVKNPNVSDSCDDDKGKDSDDEVVEETAKIEVAQAPRKFNDVREKVRYECPKASYASFKEALNGNVMHKAARMSAHNMSDKLCKCKTDGAREVNGVTERDYNEKAKDHLVGVCPFDGSMI